MEIVVGKTTIYRYDGQYGTSYSVGLKKKKQDGTYETGFMPVRFKKDVEIPTKTEINVQKAWLSFNVKDGKTYPFIFVNEFTMDEKKEEKAEEKIEEKPKENNMQIYEDFGKEITLSDEDLPF